MKFVKSDLVHLDNLRKILVSKGSYTLQGTEVMAFAECIKWIAALQVAADKEIKQEEEEKNKPAMVVNSSPVQAEAPMSSPLKKKK